MAGLPFVAGKISPPPLGLNLAPMENEHYLPVLRPYFVANEGAGSGLILGLPGEIKKSERPKKLLNYIKEKKGRQEKKWAWTLVVINIILI